MPERDAIKARRSHSEMNAESRQKLLAAARKAFQDVGYAEASMDAFSAEAGLTRGALYHHFGGKKGIFEAVVIEIDEEVSLRLAEVKMTVGRKWEGFIATGKACMKFAVDPAIRQILWLDAPSVLGPPFKRESGIRAIQQITGWLQEMMDEGIIKKLAAPEPLARIIYGGVEDAAIWLASSETPEEDFKKAAAAYECLMSGLLLDG